MTISRKNPAVTGVGRDGNMDAADQQPPLDWLARYFGRTDYLPLTRADLTALSKAGQNVEKYQGTHLFREGEEAVAAYVIESGTVELYRGPRDERRVVARLGSGAVIGDIAMFRQAPYLSSAVTIDRVRAFRLDRDRLMPLLVEHPVIALRWLVAGLNQLEAAQRRVLRLLQRTVKEQVAELLLDEANEFGEVHLSQSSLARLLGASRQSVNEALAHLRSRGIVKTGYRVVTVTDANGLADVAGRLTAVV